MRDRTSEIGVEVSRCVASPIMFPRGIPEEPGDSVPSVLGAAPSHTVPIPLGPQPVDRISVAVQAGPALPSAGT
jgi:hypothetical protein